MASEEAQSGAWRQNVVRIANTAPPDRFLLVYFIFLIHGMAIMAPWSMLTSLGESYFVGYKMSPDYVNSTVTKEDELQDWQQNFFLRLSIAGLITNFIISAISCFVPIGNGRLGLRLLVSLLVIAGCYLVYIFMALTDTSGALTFFVYLSISVTVLINIFIGIYQTSLWGIVCHLPSKYSNSVVMGNNLIGVDVSLFALIMALVQPNIRLSTAIYLGVGVGIFLIAICAYFYASIQHFYRYYVQHLEIAELQHADHPTFDTIKQHWANFLDIFFTYFITYLIYPNFARFVTLHSESSWFIGVDPKLETFIFCYLTFNFFAVCGNITVNFVEKPSPRFLWILSYSRLVFIPLFFLLNYTKPGRVNRFLVLLPYGWAFWAAMACLAYSHGYVSSLAMIFPSKLADSRLSTKAAMVSNVFLVLGISIGLACSIGADRILLKD